MMKFLVHLTRCLQNIFNKKASGVATTLEDVKTPFDSTVEPNEPLARFIRKKTDVYAATGGAKPNVFSPSSQRRDLSVYRTKKLNECEIWHLSDTFFTLAQPEKPSIARAEIPVELPTIHSLRLVADGDPHPRHLNIEGWPTEPSAILMIKTEMANMAKTFKRDS